MTKLKNSNCDKTKKATKLKKLKQQQNSKTQIVIKPKNWNCDKTQKVKFWQNLKKVFCKNNLTPQQPMRCTPGNFLRSCDVFKEQINNRF